MALSIGEEALPALTADNVTKVCVGANVAWTEELCAFLGIPRTQVEKLQQIPCLQDRLRATVEYWLSIDHAPSWRRVIAAVDFWNQFYMLSMRLHEFAGPISDPTLLARDVASVMEKVEGKKYLLGDFFKLLRVPESKVVANRMVAASWWVSYSHAPSWAKLVSILITCQERRALKEARKFLPIPTPDPELTVDAMCEILNCVAERWEWLSVSIGTPFDQIENIKKQCEDDPSRCAPTAWGYWLSSHPAPSWALVADALYENMEHDALKLLKLKYPVVLNCERVLLDCHQAIQNQGKASEIIFTAVVLGSFGAGKSSFVDRLVGQPCHTSSSFAKKAVRIEITKPSDAAGIKPKWKFLKTLHETTATVAEKLSHHTLHYPESCGKRNISKESLDHLKFGDMPAKDKLLYYDTSPAKITTPFQAITSCYKVKYELLPTGVRVNQCLQPLKAAEETWSHYITEVEGLPQFQKLFANMIPCPSLYYYVFRADHDFNAKLQGEFKGEASVCPCEASTTNRDAILQFLASVASMKAPKKPQGGSFAPPKVLFIATHVDKLKSSDKISRIDQELQKIVKETRAYKDGLIIRGSESCMLLAVNGLADYADGKCNPDFQKVRSVVECVAASGGEYRSKVPYTWSLFSATIQHCPDPVLSLSKCLEVGKECGITQREEMVRCLSFLHHLGVLCYFEGVAEVVFRDPQYLYDKVASLISSTLGARSDREGKNCVFTSDGLESILSCSEVPSCSQLIKLLQQSCVLASLVGVDVHFLPCSLICAAESGEHSALPHRRLPTLHFTFNCNYLPVGFAEAFLAGLFSISDSDCKFEAVAEINRDQISFLLGPHSDRCLFSFQTTVISVEVFPSDVADRGAISVAVVCCNLRQHIKHSLQHASKRLNLDPDESDHQSAFYCPIATCRADCHLAEVDSEAEGLPCLLKCVHSPEPVALPSTHLVWYDEDYTFPKDHDTKPEELRLPTLSNLILIKWTDGAGSTQSLRVQERVSSKWWVLGTLTKQSNERLENYRHMTLNSNFECCQRVFGYWMDNNVSDYPVTWDGLHELLCDVGVSEVARTLEEAVECILNKEDSTQ